MPAVIFIPELVEAWVVSILNTGLPLPSWMLTAVVEEIFCVSPPYQETLSNEVPVEEVMLNRFWLVEPPCKVNNPDVVVVPIPTLPPLAKVIFVVPLVIKFRPKLSNVPKVPVAPKVLPPWRKAPRLVAKVEVLDQVGMLLFISRIEPADPVAIVARLDVDDEPISKYP